MKVEAITRRPGIIFLPALANLVFFSVLNSAGTGAGISGLSQASSASIRLRKLYILNVQTPELPIPSDSYQNSDQINGWTGYLYLNGACIGPTNGETTYPRDGMLGARCQQARIGERYFVSTKPNLTQNNIFDPQIICHHGRSYPTNDTSYLWHSKLPCDLDEDAAWPRYLISLTAPFSLLLLSALTTLLTLLLRLPLVRHNLPHRHLLDILLAATTAFFLLIAAIILTSDALDVRDWVNGQHAPLVYDARLGGAFFLLLWLSMVFAVWNLGVLVAVDYVKNKRKVSQAEGLGEGEEPPGYDAVTTQLGLSLDPVDELMRR